MRDFRSRRIIIGEVISPYLPMVLNLVLMRALSAVFVIGSILAIVAFLFTYFNYAEANLHITWKWVLTPSSCTTNIQWYSGITLIVFSLVSIGFLVYEFLLLVSPTKFKFEQTLFTRLIFYWLTGFSVMGVGAMLGIAASFIILIDCAVSTFVWLFLLVQCTVVEETHQKIND